MLERFSYLHNRVLRGAAFHRSPLGPLALSLALLALPQAGWTSTIDATYDPGVEAAIAGRWELSARLMLQSMASEPDEKKALLAGPYLPHYYLGLSLYQLGDCELAAKHFEKSRRDGVVYGTRYISRLRRMESACNERSRSERQAQRDLDAAYRELERVAARTDEPRLAGFWSQGDPTAREQLQEASRELERAQQSLGKRISLGQVNGAEPMIRAVGDEDVARAATSTARAIEILQYLDSSADRHFASTDLSRAALLDEILALRMEAVRVWSASSRPVGTDASGRDLTKEFQRVTRLHLGDADASFDQLSEARAELSAFIRAAGALPSKPDPTPSVIARPEPIPAIIPTSLRQAATAYFSGNYEDVLAVLAGAELEDRRDLAHLYLFRAAALYSLYLVADEPDPSQLRDAEQNVTRCLATGVDLAPTTDAFSPRFIRFFEQRASLASEGRISIGQRTEPAQVQHPRIPGS